MRQTANLALFWLLISDAINDKSESVSAYQIDATHFFMGTFQSALNQINVFD